MKSYLLDQKSNIITILTIIGLVDTVYLINLHYLPGVCIGESTKIGEFLVDCGAVASSNYSELFGIPIAIFGFFYYLSIFVLANYSNIIESVILTPIGLTATTSMQILVSGGIFVSSYLFYLQIFVLKLICSYCMISILITILLFTSITIIFLDQSRENLENN